MIFGQPPALNPPEGLTFTQLLEWHRSKIDAVNLAITHGTPIDWGKVAKMRAKDLDTAALKARQDFRKRTHTDQDDALLVLRECVETAKVLGGLKSVKVPMKTVTLNDIWDGAKKTMREQRIARNQVAESRVCGPVGREEYFRWLREERLANAIERTQLPHEMTIHERIMPYRVKE